MLQFKSLIDITSTDCYTSLLLIFLVTDYKLPMSKPTKRTQISLQRRDFG